MLASFPSECRKWRRLRNLSQLDLALMADPTSVCPDPESEEPAPAK